MPQALGAQGLDRGRQVVAFCGDGGFSMLMGDLLTAVSHDLPVKLIVFDNGRLGMVKLEMEQVGLPEFGTVLHNPDFSRVAEACGMRGFRAEHPDEVESAVKAALAVDGPALVDCVTNPDEIAITQNATMGMNFLANGLDLAAGDEVITTDHAYRACMNQLARLAAARGATITAVTIPLPFNPGALIDAVARAITPRTRLALFDHITSPTALRLPIEPLVALATARGIPVIVDGAHAPGQIALDVASVGATWYAGNCHKWLCGPKGSGFLVVKDDLAVRPVVTSHGASPEYGPANRLHAELDWSGTHDPTPHLTVPSAIATVAAFGGSWPAIYARNHALACEMRNRLADALGAGRIAPDDALGTMAALPIQLPPGIAPLALEGQLLREGWEVPIVDFPGGPLVRVSAHLYNHAGEADLLAAKLRSLGVTLR